MNKMRVKVSSRFVITRSVRVWKNPFEEKHVYKTKTILKNSLLEKIQWQVCLL